MKSRRTTRDKDGLTDQQRQFVQAYILDPRARRAAIQAGYPIERAAREAQLLLANTTIAGIIKEHRDDLAKQFNVTKERVVAELALIGFSNMGDYTRLTDDGDRVLDLSETPREHLAAIQELTSEVYLEGRGDDAREVKKTKIKLMSKREALVDLGKTLGLFGKNDNDDGGGSQEVVVRIIGGLPDNIADVAPGSNSSVQPARPKNESKAKA